MGCRAGHLYALYEVFVCEETRVFGEYEWAFSLLTGGAGEGLADKVQLLKK